MNIRDIDELETYVDKEHEIAIEKPEELYLPHLKKLPDLLSFKEVAKYTCGFPLLVINCI